MKKFCVVGFPISHSFSPEFFRKKFEKLKLDNCLYTAQELADISQIRSLIQSEQLTGFNVTIPHKQTIRPFLDELDETAQKIGGVNCVKVLWKENQFKTKGYNTDWIGFTYLLNQLNRKPKNAMILGAGGAAQAVKYALTAAGIKTISISREAKQGLLSYADIDEKLMAGTDLFVNTTPLGMYPNIDQKPELPYHLLTANHSLIDLIYNPQTTAFLKEGERKGCQTLNGLEMLHIQAEASWEIWMSPQL